MWLSCTLNCTMYFTISYCVVCFENLLYIYTYIYYYISICSVYLYVYTGDQRETAFQSCLCSVHMAALTIKLTLTWVVLYIFSIFKNLVSVRLHFLTFQYKHQETFIYSQKPSEKKTHGNKKQWHNTKCIFQGQFYYLVFVIILRVAKNLLQHFNA